MKNDETSNPNITNDYKGVRSNDSATILKNQKKAKKDGLALGIIATAFIAVVILVAAGIYGNSRIKQEKEMQVSMLENQKSLFEVKLTSRDSIINEWMLTFDQIEKDLNIVKEKEHILTVSSEDREFSKDRRDQILKDIEYINTMLDQNKKKIASLNAQLKNSGGAIKVLQSKVAELEASMKMRETEIADLKEVLVNKDFEIGQLNTRMTEQNVAIAQKDEEISNKSYEMNKAYLVSGSYKTLKEKGLVYKEGGFLGLGKKESLAQNFSDSSFSQISINDTKIIPVNSKTAKLITDHPSDSYSMVKGDDNKIAYIEIKDPIQFWKISKYAVLETRN